MIGEAGSQVAGFEDGQAHGKADVLADPEHVLEIGEGADVHGVDRLGQSPLVDRRHVDRPEVDDGATEDACGGQRRGHVGVALLDGGSGPQPRMVG